MLKEKDVRIRDFIAKMKMIFNVVKVWTINPFAFRTIWLVTADLIVQMSPMKILGIVPSEGARRDFSNAQITNVSLKNTNAMVKMNVEITGTLKSSFEQL